MLKAIPILVFIFLLNVPFASSQNSNIDYESQIQPIFNARCVSCHGGLNGVSLNNYTNTMNSVGNSYKVKIVKPGNASESPLVEKLKPNPSFGSRMPQGGSLSSNDIALIETWINEGANLIATSNETINEPIEFALLGNYPNPFNPSTAIQFSIGSNSVVTLQVFDLYGKEVLKKAQSFSTGVSVYAINLAGESSGVYFYRLSAINVNGGVKVLTGKMTLIK